MKKNNKNNKKIIFWSLGILTLILSVLGMTLMSVVNLSSLDFTMTNTELVGGNIQLSKSFGNIISQSLPLNSGWLSSYGQASRVGLRIIPNSDLIITSITKSSTTTALNCYIFDISGVQLSQGVFSGQTCILTSSLILKLGIEYGVVVGNPVGAGNFVAFVDNSGNYPFTSTNFHSNQGLTSATGVSSVYLIGVQSISTKSVNGYLLTGNLVQTTPTTTTAQYDTLTLDYNITALNGGTITPTLIVNGVETSLTNNVLTGTFPVGTNVSVKFSFTGSTSVTPQLNNNIVLSGSYTAPIVVNSNSNVATISKKNVLSILSAVAPKSQVQTYGSTSNKFQDFLRTFFNSIWGFLGV